MRDSGGRALKYTINGTMMRIDLPQALADPADALQQSLDRGVLHHEAERPGLQCAAQVPA